MTASEIFARMEQARAEMEPISSEIQELMGANGLHNPGRRAALKAALERHDVLADEYGKLAARYYALVLSGKLPLGPV